MRRLLRRQRLRLRQLRFVRPRLLDRQRRLSRHDLLQLRDLVHQLVHSLRRCVPRPPRQVLLLVPALPQDPALRQDQALLRVHCLREIAVRFLPGIADLSPTEAGNRARAARVQGSRCVHSNPARGGHSRLDLAALAVQEDHNHDPLSSVAVRCPRARVPARARPGVPGCFPRSQRNCRRRRSRASPFTPASLPSANVPFWTSASKKVSANFIRQGSVRARAAAPWPSLHRQSHARRER